MTDRIGFPRRPAWRFGVAAAFLLLASCDQQSGQQGTDAAEPTPSAPTSTAAPMATTLTADQVARVGTFAKDWPAEPVYVVSFNPLDPNLSGRSVEAGPSLFDPADDHWGLPSGEGQELVEYSCAACHSLQIVMQQHATEERWDTLLTWMVEEQGMPPLAEDERARVLAYLVEHFGPSAGASETPQ